ncbi:hypothetical protein QQ045_008417 [Rhodiola kirilowii]
MKLKLKFTMDKSWLELDRGDSCYAQGLVYSVEFVKHNRENTQGYKTWTSHGEKSNQSLPYMLR